MDYISTRGAAPVLSFTDALITGLAEDGGLYLPKSYPEFSTAEIAAFEIAAFAGQPYAAVAEAVIWPFVSGTLERSVLRDMIASAYTRVRSCRGRAALAARRQSFPARIVSRPDFGVQGPCDAAPWPAHAARPGGAGPARDHHRRYVGRHRRRRHRRLSGLPEVDVFILYPNGRVSDVQRRQMTTIAADNVHTIAIEGTFDDAQNMVKALFAHKRFRQEFALAGVNSINWARVMAQIVYYFTSAVALGGPHRPVSFVVPDRQFRRYPRGLDREKNGAADRTARHRDQFQ